MSIVLLSTIGSGVLPGMRGVHLGTGVTTRIGGTTIIAGRMTGTGITAMHGIITTTGALSVRQVTYTMAIMSCTVV